jgi:hypothetical protein
LRTIGSVTSLREVEASARNGELGDLVGALRSDPASRWLATALRIDLAAIVADPALALQTVWARASFAPSTRGPLAGWRAEHAGRPWARALRPPAHPIGGPLEEEYRGDFRGADGVAVTDGTVTVFHGGSATVIDRATGRSAPAPAPVGPSWTPDGSTGTVVHSGRVGATVGALDPTGTTLATVADTAVRVWSLSRLDGAPAGLPGSDTGPAYAMWSPDGSRLLTGSALCDGVDGRLIAVLPMDGAGYPEADPAPGARAVGDADVVEFTPLGGMTLWDARGGAPVARDPSRRYTAHRDRLWISPDARLYVHAAGSAALLRVRDGALLAPLGDDPVRDVTWSHDSSRFTVTYDDGGVQSRTAGGDPVDGAVPVRRHPYDARHEAGYMILDPAAPGQPAYRIACDGPLVPDPTGTRWASPTVHVALEPDG